MKRQPFFQKSVTKEQNYETQQVSPLSSIMTDIQPQKTAALVTIQI